MPIMKLRENDDPDIREIAQYVYENVFLKYTMKQWGQKPEEISPEVTGRVPVLISYDNRYFQDKYQGVPKDGFTPMFEHMLDHENIEVVLDTDCRDVLKFTGNEILFEGKPFEGDVIYTERWMSFLIVNSADCHIVRWISILSIMMRSLIRDTAW